MRSIRYTARARGQVRAIARYSVKEFGADAADRYAQGMKATLQLLAEHPLGEPIADRPGVRRWRFASHWIYYRVTEDEIVVVNIVGTMQAPPP